MIIIRSQTQKWKSKTSKYCKINKIPHLCTQFREMRRKYFIWKRLIEIKCPEFRVFAKEKTKNTEMHANSAKVKYVIWFKWNQNNDIVLGHRKLWWKFARFNRKIIQHTTAPRYQQWFCTIVSKTTTRINPTLWCMFFK